ncbi:MAG: cobalamin biosynthesis protein [Deltaproteobacteria bacterium]|nr:cobalamin biosynthesis protein [Deltaproteobacteria bacterium]
MKENNENANCAISTVIAYNNGRDTNVQSTINNQQSTIKRVIMFESAIILFLAFILDLLLGDPRYRFHPIRLIGRCISFFTHILRRAGLDGRWGGVVLVMMVVFIFLTAFLASGLVLHRINILLSLGFDLFVCYSCLALKDLFYHMDRVNHALKGDNLAEARKAISMVVGREVRFLDEKGISRAAIETMAENFVDGFLSPIFWYLSGGILGYIFGLSPVMTAVVFMLTFKVASMSLAGQVQNLTIS